MTVAAGRSRRRRRRRSHNPSVVGSSPTRPTSELRKFMTADRMIRDRGANGRRHDPCGTARGRSRHHRAVAAGEGVCRLRPRVGQAAPSRRGGVGRIARGRRDAERSGRGYSTRSTSSATQYPGDGVSELLARYLETLDVEPTTRTRYEGIIRIHLRPARGSLPLSKLDGDILDRCFGQLPAAGTAATPRPAAVSWRRSPTAPASMPQAAAASGLVVVMSCSLT